MLRALEGDIQRLTAIIEKEIDCEHEPGKKYEGRLAYMIYDVLTFREWSYVKLPADTQAKNNRYELIVPVEENVGSGDSNRHILPTVTQIRENIGSIDCDCPDAAPNFSIYFSPGDNVFIDMLPNNIEFGNKISHVLDGVDLYECKNGICSYKPDANSAVDNVEKKEGFSDQDNKLRTKEEDSDMENIKSFEDLMKLDFVKKAFEKHESDTIADLKVNIVSKDKEIEKLTSDLEARDTTIGEKDAKIQELNDKIKSFEGDRKAVVVDKIIDLQKKIGHPFVASIMKKEKETVDKEIKKYREELLDRDFNSLEFQHKDLVAEAELKADDNGGDDKKDKDITDSVKNDKPVNNQAADSGDNDSKKSTKNDTKDSNPVDKLFD